MLNIYAEVKWHFDCMKRLKFKKKKLSAKEQIVSGGTGNVDVINLKGVTHLQQRGGGSL